METLLRRYPWIVHALVMAGCSLLFARATSTLIESILVHRDEGLQPAAHVVGVAAPVAALAASKPVADILRRNIFCSACNGPGVKAPPPRTTLPLRVLAIMFAPAPADARWSVAIIRDDDSHSVGPYTVGSRMRGATVEAIQGAKVDLDFGGGRHEFLDLLDRPAARPSASASPGGRATSDPVAAELARGIRKLGEHRYEVQRATVEALLGDPTALAAGARIFPEVREGRGAGFRLTGIRPEGPFATIGLRNGDLILAINDLQMTGPDQALLAYTKLRTAQHISVAIEREGQPISLDYNIR